MGKTLLKTGEDGNGRQFLVCTACFKHRGSKRGINQAGGEEEQRGEAGLSGDSGDWGRSSCPQGLNSFGGITLVPWP